MMIVKCLYGFCVLMSVINVLFRFTNTYRVGFTVHPRCYLVFRMI